MLRRPALVWLALQALALWPHALWSWRRMTDGSDDPLGAVALIALLALVLHHATRLRMQPHMGWLAGAAALSVASTVAGLQAPPLCAALLAVLALAAGIIAWLPAGIARLPFAGLAVLALPLLSSLQFYVGYPLRLVTAQLSTWLLQLCGLPVARVGASMTVGAQLVIVDAPCSGVQMAWIAYFTAFIVAALAGTRDGAFLRRLPLVGAVVLGGNALRNALLVWLEAQPAAPGELVHQCIGLALLAMVCVAVLHLMSRRADHVQPA